MEKKFLHEFFKHLTENICTCECAITGIKNEIPEVYEKYMLGDKTVPKTLGLPKTLGQCNNIRSDMEDKIEYIIESMRDLKILTVKKGKYYILNGYKRLTWKNIQSMNKKDTEVYKKENANYYNGINEFFNGKNFLVYVKYIFWYLRKIVVDTLIGKIVEYTRVTAVSVGSTKLESDYDVTLYGNFLGIYKTIHTFNKQFALIFNESSDTIFDTNVYGASFIKLNSGEMVCGEQKFEYIPSSTDESDAISQHIWAYIKVLVRLENVLQYNSVVYDLLESTINKQETKYNGIFESADAFLNEYDINMDLYDKIVLLLGEVSVKNEMYNNYISYVNYNGSETYFTRGAFLDVVVNQQMCGEEKVPLSKHDYLDSFIENVADLMVHINKEKYTVRAQLALGKLIPLDGKYGKVQSILVQIKDLQKKCKTTKTILECSNFLIMHLCMTIISEVSEIFFDSISENVIKSGISKFESFAFKSSLPSSRSLERITLSSRESTTSLV
jgi:hypothetical protein